MSFIISNSQELKNNEKIVNNSYKYIYYVDILNVTSKTICKNIENIISKKQGVVSFRTVGFPSKYFILKSNVVVSQGDIENWLTELNVSLSFFASESRLEDLFMNKQKKG